MIIELNNLIFTTLIDKYTESEPDGYVPIDME